MQGQDVVMEPSKSGKSTPQCTVSLPIDFFDELSRANSLEELLSTTTHWIRQVFRSDRTSITFSADSEHLRLYKVDGKNIIPQDTLIPISETFVGQVFLQKLVAICPDTRECQWKDCRWLESANLLSCMNAPLIHNQKCFGTLNIAHHKSDAYSQHDALIFSTLSQWISKQIYEKQHLDELQLLANLDPLTGILNRRAFLDATKTIGQQPRHYDVANAILFIDIDSFKHLNDTYGHMAGDEMLQAIAKVVEQYKREDDLFARFGGEEFTLLLRNVDKDNALRIAETLRALIEGTYIQNNGKRIHCTASIGVTVPELSDSNFHQAIARADEALYEAKGQGKNRVVFKCS